MTKILFQGDSITDCQRNRTDPTGLGQGYTDDCGTGLGMRQPGNLEFVNRAISGNRIVDLYARWKADCWNLKPDVISILIGVNDVWHELTHENGVDAKRFYNIYDLLLTETRERLPHCKIILLEPFLLRGPATEQNDFTLFSQEVKSRSEATYCLAQKHGASLVLLQDSFSKLARQAPENHWLFDGVHPTAAGHAVIAEKWLKTWNQEII